MPNPPMIRPMISRNVTGYTMALSTVTAPRRGADIAGVGQRRGLDAPRVHRVGGVDRAIDSAAARTVGDRDVVVEHAGKIDGGDEQETQKRQQEGQFGSGDSSTEATGTARR